MKWKDFFKQYKLRFSIVSLLFLSTLVFIYFFLIFIEQREGVSLHDPLLNLLNSYDVSIPLFILTYSGTLFGVYNALCKPSLAILTAVTYMFVLWFRMICMYFMPLEPPEHIIPLRDFILESTFYSGNVNLKDLFFSGHTASMFLFYITADNKKIKYIYLFVTILVALFVLIQHAHYTIDVLVAPIMVWFAYQLATSIQKKWFS